ncbi:hypothetical protein KR067_001514, partial [Drosophila pandora]
KGLIVFQLCSGGSDKGNKLGITCKVRAMNRMWYYISRRKTCLKMKYLGCGGNNNRYCSMDHCLQSCAP